MDQLQSWNDRERQQLTIDLGLRLADIPRILRAAVADGAELIFAVVALCDHENDGVGADVGVGVGLSKDGMVLVKQLCARSMFDTTQGGVVSTILLVWRVNKSHLRPKWPQMNRTWAQVHGSDT